jgi:hypothetical protein
MSAEAQVDAPTVSEPAPSSSPKATKRTASKAKVPKASPKTKVPTAPKKTASKAAKTHPAFAQMIAKSIAELKDKKGSSRSAILKYIVQHYSVGEHLVSVSYP